MCSKAMALHAEGETRVFGDEFGVVQSLWHIIEKPELIKSKHVTKIWSMRRHKIYRRPPRWRPEPCSLCGTIPVTLKIEYSWIENFEIRPLSNSS
ncbi:hypothetical protein HBI72_147940 [Parastagonospora nodorum]|nr:hypothetical protein HBI72_147940 [Parastagonospora nodorum]